MKKIKSITVLMMAAVFCLFSVSFMPIGKMDTVASANTVTDPDEESVSASTIRVLLSTGDRQVIKFTVHGNYSVHDGQALPDNTTYNVINNGGTLLLVSDATSQQIAFSNPIHIEENTNPNPNANMITIYTASGKVWHSYQGSMKFWVGGNYIDAVNHIYLEKYLYGVVPNEMPNGSPIEALKAQAVAARSYAYKYIEGSRDRLYDVTDDSSKHQVYAGYDSRDTNSFNAIDSTATQVLKYNGDGSVIKAYFGSSNGGQTERTENVPWSSALGYFAIQDDPYDTLNPSSSKEIVSFPMGTSVDKPEDMPTLPLSPMALGEITGISSTYLYCRPDTGRGTLKKLKRGDKVWIYERNTAWTKAKVGSSIGFIPSKYIKAYYLQAKVSASKKFLLNAPSAKGKKVLALPKNAKVTILSWGSYCLADYNGTQGYISKSCLKLSGYPAAPGVIQQAGNEFTITGTTYLRQSGKSSGKKIVKLTSGARVTLVSGGKKYHLVSYGGRTGYVDVKYTQLVIPSLVLTNTPVPPGGGESTANVRYTQDDIDPKLVSFFKYFASAELANKNKTQPDGAKYYTSQDTIKIKQITAMSGIQTAQWPHCVHTGHNAGNCPSRDYTGVTMTIVLKVLKEDASRAVGYNREDYTWNFSFNIDQYLNSSAYPQWDVFKNNYIIFAVEQSGNIFNLINRRYGHGVGLSQRGAQQRAKSTDTKISDYRNILKFYYPYEDLTTLGYSEAAIPAQVQAMSFQVAQPLIVPETPAPTPSAEPSPSESVSPSASETPAPSETASPLQSEVPSETPSESISPSTSPETSQTPSAGAQPSGA